ncbi:unnamed protein product [Symbiodinium sp. CCMP2456]|nr:unnamed protein product [Symbiodinium sp. CCMP2456]
MPDPNTRTLVISKARELLTEEPGLLVVADTVAAIGRPRAGPPPEWVLNVEAAGFKLIRDPQMHFSTLRDARTGVVNRASCFSFKTVAKTGMEEALPPLQLPRDSGATTRTIAQALPRQRGRSSRWRASGTVRKRSQKGKGPAWSRLVTVGHCLQGLL